MATDISMASNALMLVGDAPINALSESQAAANLYAQTYEYVLSEHPWSFAMKEQYLSRLTATPDQETGYQYAFQMPSDCIRMWAVMPTVQYRIVGELLYANADKLLARYLYQVDETQLPPHAVEAIEYKLAAKFAIAVAEDENKSMLFERKYQDALGVAMAKDSQQHPFVGLKRNNVRYMRSRR